MWSLYATKIKILENAGKEVTFTPIQFLFFILWGIYLHEESNTAANLNISEEYGTD